jgi:biotin carboxyl carrier protein
MRIYGLVALAVGAGVLTAAGATYPVWRGRWFPAAPAVPAPADEDHDDDHDHIHLSPQARANLGLEVRPARLSNYWRTLSLPGVVIDRPGQCDVTVPAPVSGVVLDIAAVPGRLVLPGDELLTLRLVGDAVPHNQSELYKTLHELAIVREQRERLAAAARTGVVPEAKLIELANQERRLTAQRQALEFELAASGLTPDQVQAIAEGQFVRETRVAVPTRRPSSLPLEDSHPPLYEVEKLHVRLGDQVQAGQALYRLHDPQHLVIEGHAFPREAAAVERALRNGWPVQADFLEAPDPDWPPVPELRIEYLAATVDPASRTLAFYLPLSNPSREQASGGRATRLWRFRPGQRVRLFVPVEEWSNVFVLPPAAVVRSGADAFVFEEDGDELEPRPVHVLYEDSRAVVVANDGSIRPGQALAHTCAAALHRILQAQAHGDEHDHHHHDH